MDIVKQMSDTLANQIAAGEVIERPSSVVKELVENSIDAQATEIIVELTEAGIEGIKVSDNGIGLSQNDLRHAFLPHATSKLYDTNDLFAIRTLGFRGEALASIASVSHVLMESTQPEQDKGYQIELKGGEIISESVTNARLGTRITVERLFYNTPARLKHLKRLQTELSHTTRFIQNISMAHPNIRFELFHNDKLIYRTSGRSDLLQAIANVYHPSIARQLISIQASNSTFKVDGYISPTNLTRTNRYYMHWMINGRPVHSHVLDRGVIAAYGRQLMIGRYPITVMNVQVDPRLVDVNVHPTKYTVRLSQEEELVDLFTEAIHEQLEKHQNIPQIEVESVKERAEVNEKYSPYQSNLARDLSEPSENTLQSNKIANYFQRTDSPASLLDSELSNEQAESVEFVKEETSEAGQVSNQLSFESTETNHFIDFNALRYVGQIHGTYLIAENERGFYLIDQHAAQEKINYEHFMAEDYPIQEQQTLLIPELIHLSSAQISQLLEIQSDLERLGISIEPFGEQTYKLDSYPVWLKDTQLDQFIPNLIDLLINEPNLTVNELKERSIIMQSCKGAIKANHYLDSKQAQFLIEQLGTLKDPFHCPHGRPVLIEFVNATIEKLFKRIQDSHTTDPFDQRII